MDGQIAVLLVRAQLDEPQEQLSTTLSDEK
jgi:hypothetical protein